ncbi:MAG: right-handed parallel beta-helix repeat-containing protein [Actinomycetota bacterium]|nr:right-handed parallel beta-helix repeat-containing protein [Actinomycetota bacterium]
MSAVLLTFGLVLASPAHAANVACGETVVASTVLTADIGPCPTGIVIGADNITLDLGGHQVIGLPSPGEGPGILIKGRTGVRIVNGTVRLFDAGVAIEASSGTTLTNLALLQNVGPSSGLYGDGILLVSSHQNQLFDNVIRGNGPFSGVSLFGSDGNGLDRNIVEGNNVELGPNTMADTGIFLGIVGRARGSQFNTLSNNVVRGNGFDGIRLASAAQDNVLRSNVVEGNGLHSKQHRKGDGISLAGFLIQRTTITGNTVRGNAANGIFLAGPSGLSGATNNQIQGNVAMGNNRLPEGTPDFDLRDDNLNPPCDANSWTQNTFQTRNQPCIS